MTKPSVSYAFLLAVSVGLVVGDATAQTLGAAGSVELAAVRLYSATGPRVDELSGLARGAAGRLSVWRVYLELGYVEGSLRATGLGAAAPRDLVEGRVMLGVNPAPWLSLKGGPRARGFVLGGVTQRWIHWEGRMRVDAPVSGRDVVGYLEVWRAMGGSVANAASSFGGGHGGEAGMMVRVPRTPLSLRISYGIQRASLASGLLTETFESLALGASVGSAK